MSDVSARQALRYATEDSMVGLFLLVFGGWTLVTLSQLVLTSSSGTVQMLGFVGYPVGAFAAFVGVVAIAYKIVVDSRSA